MEDVEGSEDNGAKNGEFAEQNARFAEKYFTPHHHFVILRNDSNKMKYENKTFYFSNAGSCSPGGYLLLGR